MAKVFLGSLITIASPTLPIRYVQQDYLYSLGFYCGP